MVLMYFAAASMHFEVSATTQLQSGVRFIAAAKLFLKQLNLQPFFCKGQLTYFLAWERVTVGNSAPRAAAARGRAV